MYTTIKYLSSALLITIVSYNACISQNPITEKPDSTEILRKNFRTKLNNLSHRLKLEIKESEQKITAQRHYLDSLITILDMMEQDREKLKNLIQFTRPKFYTYKLKIEAYNRFFNRKDSLIKEIEEGIKNKKTAIPIKQSTALRVDLITINYIDKQGKEHSGGSYRKRNVKELKVRFSLADNKAAKLGKKSFIILFFNPKGKIFYSTAENFIFDNSQQIFAFTYKKDTPFNRGKYTVGIHCEGKEIGQATFSIR